MVMAASKSRVESSIEELRNMIVKMNEMFSVVGIKGTISPIGQFTFKDLGITLTFNAAGCSDTCSGCTGSCSGACSGCTGCSGCSITSSNNMTGDLQIDDLTTILKNPEIVKILSAARTK